jgi:hypothetical protein
LALEFAKILRKGEFTSHRPVKPSSKR